MTQIEQPLPSLAALRGWALSLENEHTYAHAITLLIDDAVRAAEVAERLAHSAKQALDQRDELDALLRAQYRFAPMHCLNEIRARFGSEPLEGNHNANDPPRHPAH